MPNLKPFQSLGSRRSLCLFASVIAWPLMFSIAATLHGIALDPTHDRPVDETYVKIAVGRDYADVPPVAGNYKGTTERKLEVKVDIKRLD